MLLCCLINELGNNGNVVAFLVVPMLMLMLLNTILNLIDDVDGGKALVYLTNTSHFKP